MKISFGKRIVSVLLALILVFQLSVVANAEATGVEGFVTRLYENILGREPEAEGLQYWVNGLATGTNTAATTVDSFFVSNEFQAMNLNDIEYLNTLYKTILGREPDAVGLNYWLTNITNGYTRRSVLAGFLSSYEFDAMCTSYGVIKGQLALSTADLNPEKVVFITNLYRTILGRDPEPAGLQYWMDYILSGQSACQVVSNFVVTPEFESKGLSNAEYIGCLYKAMLGREGGASEIDYWLAIMNASHCSRKYILSSFAASYEFNDICNRAGITVGSIEGIENRDINVYVTGFVSGAYNTLLNREASTSEVNYWSGSLLGTSTVKDFILGVLTSSEFAAQGNTAEQYVSKVCKVAFGREATEYEMSVYSSLVAAGNSSAFLEAVFANNDYINLCAALGIPASFVEGWNLTAGGKVFIQNGAPLVGWQRIDGFRYYFDSSAGNSVAIGWKDIDGLKYFFNSDGTLCQDVRSIIGPRTDYYLTVNCTTNTVMVYAKDGNGTYNIPVCSFICSTGADGATVAGNFRIQRLESWRILMGDVYGQYCSRINGNILFHSVWFYEAWNNNSQSVKQYKNLGTSCSHGCVRLTVADAKWIFDNCNKCSVSVIYGPTSDPFDRPVPPPMTQIVYGDFGHDPTDIWG